MVITNLDPNRRLLVIGNSVNIHAADQPKPVVTIKGTSDANGEITAMDVHAFDSNVAGYLVGGATLADRTTNQSSSRTPTPSTTVQRRRHPDPGRLRPCHRLPRDQQAEGRRPDRGQLCHAGHDSVSSNAGAGIKVVSGTHNIIKKNDVFSNKAGGIAIGVTGTPSNSNTIAETRCSPTSAPAST